MTITILKKNEDGTLLGADENGKLYRGTPRWAGFDEVQRTVASQEDGSVLVEFTIDGQVISRATVAQEAFDDAPWRPRKEYDNVVIDGEARAIERKRHVVKWEAI